MDFSENGLVSRLAKTDQSALRSLCRATVLRANEVLTSPNAPTTSVYFLTGAVVAQLMGSAGTGAVAVGLSGFAGVVGLQLAVGEMAGDATALVQTQGMAWSVDGRALRKMASSRAPLLLAIARHLWIESQSRAQYAENLQRQSVTQRLARWIVDSQGPQRGLPLTLTHSHLAAMLGVRRASVSTAALELRDLGLVDYVRGSISILDQGGLEAVSRAHRRAAASP